MSKIVAVIFIGALSLLPFALGAQLESGYHYQDEETQQHRFIAILEVPLILFATFLAFGIIRLVNPQNRPGFLLLASWTLIIAGLWRLWQMNTKLNFD